MLNPSRGLLFSVIVQPVVEPMDRFTGLTNRTACVALEMFAAWYRRYKLYKHILRKNFHILEFSRIWKFGRHIKCSLIKSGFILLLANTHLVLALAGVKQWVLRRKLYACISVYCRIHVKVDLPTC